MIVSYYVVVVFSLHATKSMASRHTRATAIPTPISGDSGIDAALPRLLYARSSGERRGDAFDAVVAAIAARLGL